METVLLSAGALSRFIVISSNYFRNQGYAYFDKERFALLGEESVFSPLVKIEAERATVNGRYVNLRFCHSNRYWERRGRFIVAESNRPEEDTAKPSCTLFEAVSVAGGNGLFFLNHVQSGGRLLFEQPSMRFYVNLNPNPVAGFLRFVNWDTLVKLPKHVAFKGFNDRYVQGVWLFEWLLQVLRINRPFLQFEAQDPNRLTAGYRISLLPDGHVRIFSNYFNMHWRRDDRSVNSGWIWADSADASPDDINTRFWPVKVDDNTIALRNVGNNNFCKALTADGFTNCLNAMAPTIVNEARLVVEELVAGRRIFNVRYRMEDSRIFNETPFVAGTTQVFNHSDTEAGSEVEVAYEVSRSRSFSRSLSLSAGVNTTIEAGVPLITRATVEVSYQINTTLEWNDTVTTTESVRATGAVRVPPKSLATVSYVGTIGTCDVPFSYTQQDRSSTDGRITINEEIDGVFRGVNAYNFSFVVERTQPLGDYSTH